MECFVIIKFGVSNGIEEKCQYCNKNFKSLGRHVWRCTAKLYTQSSQITGNHGDQNNKQIQFIENSSRSLVNLNDQHSLNAPEGTITEYDKKMQSKQNNEDGYIKFHCRKLCKGICGLRAHHRFCKINDMPELRELFNNELVEIREDSITCDKNFEPNDQYIPQNKLPKTGIKLPKTKSDWKQANEYFRVTLDHTKEIVDINEEITNVQNTIYDYFRNECGTVVEEVSNSEYKQTYEKLSKRQLKKTLSELKSNKRSELEIRYASNLIRKK